MGEIFFEPDFNKLHYSLCSQGDNFLTRFYEVEMMIYFHILFDILTIHLENEKQLFEDRETNEGRSFVEEF